MNTIKKNLSLLSIVLISIVLTACGPKEEKTSYTLEQNGTKITLVYTHEGDKVLKQTTSSTIPYSSLGVTTKEEAKTMLEPMSKQYQNVDGLTEKIEFKEDVAVESISVDYNKLDFDKAKSIPGITSIGDKKTGVSLKKSEEQLLSTGFEKQSK